MNQSFGPSNTPARAAATVYFLPLEMEPGAHANEVVLALTKHILPATVTEIGKQYVIATAMLRHHQFGPAIKYPITLKLDVSDPTAPQPRMGEDITVLILETKRNSLNEERLHGIRIEPEAHLKKLAELMEATRLNVAEPGLAIGRLLDLRSSFIREVSNPIEAYDRAIDEFPHLKLPAATIAQLHEIVNEVDCSFALYPLRALFDRYHEVRTQIGRSPAEYRTVEELAEKVLDRWHALTPLHAELEALKKKIAGQFKTEGMRLAKEIADFANASEAFCKKVFDNLGLFIEGTPEEDVTQASKPRPSFDATFIRSAPPFTPGPVSVKICEVPDGVAVLREFPPGELEHTIPFVTRYSTRGTIAITGFRDDGVLLVEQDSHPGEQELEAIVKMVGAPFDGRVLNPDDARSHLFELEDLCSYLYPILDLQKLSARSVPDEKGLTAMRPIELPVGKVDLQGIVERADRALVTYHCACIDKECRWVIGGDFDGFLQEGEQYGMLVYPFGRGKERQNARLAFHASAKFDPAAWGIGTPSSDLQQSPKTHDTATIKAAALGVCVFLTDPKLMHDSSIAAIFVHALRFARYRPHAPSAKAPVYFRTRHILEFAGDSASLLGRIAGLKTGEMLVTPKDYLYLINPRFPR